MLPVSSARIRGDIRGGGGGGGSVYSASGEVVMMQLNMHKMHAFDSRRDLGHTPYIEKSAFPYRLKMIPAKSVVLIEWLVILYM